MIKTTPFEMVFIIREQDMKRKTMKMIMMIAFVVIALLAVWFVTDYLLRKTDMTPEQVNALMGQIETYGILAGVLITGAAFLLDWRSSGPADQACVPEIEFVNDQVISISKGRASLYAYDKKYKKKLQNIYGKGTFGTKEKWEILMIMNEAKENGPKLGEVGFLNLEFRCNSQINRFTLNSIKLFFCVENCKEGCLTNYMVSDKDTYITEGYHLYRNTKYNRVMKFQPYIKLNSAKPYIKDGKYVVELMLIYQAAAGSAETMNKELAVAEVINSELDQARQLVMELDYTVKSNLGDTNTVTHALYFDCTGDKRKFRLVSYEIQT